MIPIATGIGVSTAANTTADVSVSKSYEFLGKGRLMLVARGSATGMQVSLFVGGVQLAKASPLFRAGTAGTLDMSTDIVIDQKIQGGRVEFQLINSTGGALTTDYYLGFEPQ